LQSNRSCKNVCRNINGKLLLCLETRDYGTSFACLCAVTATTTALTTNADCDVAVTLTTRPTTTQAPTPAPSPCVNGGVFANGVCNCPSGYTGAVCAAKDDVTLCDRIKCKNGGVCAVRNSDGVGPYQAVCLCRYGTEGEYCELNGTLGACSTGSCLNGGNCRDVLIGTTRFAYCHCPSAYNGVKCDNLYFQCPSVGKFPDNTMFEQGKYFECTSVGGSLRAQQKSCPKGLRFNQMLQLCSL